MAEYTEIDQLLGEAHPQRLVENFLAIFRHFFFSVLKNAL